MLRARERAQFPLSAIAGEESACAAATGDEAPHYAGHRMRLRERFLDAGAGALADYELSFCFAPSHAAIASRWRKACSPSSAPSPRSSPPRASGCGKSAG